LFKSSSNLFPSFSAKAPEDDNVEGVTFIRELTLSVLLDSDRALSLAASLSLTLCFESTFMIRYWTVRATGALTIAEIIATMNMRVMSPPISRKWQDPGDPSAEKEGKDGEDILVAHDPEVSQ
jgi:hypothetical protein